MKKNKYFISVDIEGITGVCDDSQTSQGNPNYEMGRKYMLHDTNAVIEAILKEEPNSEILVRDAHGSSLNLNLFDLHPKASLIQGWGFSIDMMEGLDKSFRAAFLVGYHSGASHNFGVLCHTMMGGFRKIKINESEMNETGIAAITAAEYSVPIIFLSGDDLACEQARQQIAEIETVAVKKSLSRNSINSLPLVESKKKLQDGAVTALRKLKQLGVDSHSLKTKAPYRVEIEFLKNAYENAPFIQIQKILEYDKGFAFDENKFILKFKADNAKIFSRKFLLIMHLLISHRKMQKS